VKKQFLLSLTANLLRVVLGFVFFWQVSQALGLSTLGEYLYVTAALGYFGSLIDYGFNLFVLNTASRSVGNLRPLFLRIVLSKLVLTIACAAVLAGLYGIAFAQQGLIVTALFFLIVVLMSFSGLLIQFFKALGRFEYEFYSALIASMLPVVALFVLRDGLTLVGLGCIVLAVRIVALVFQLMLFWRVTQGQAWVGADEAPKRLLPSILRDINSNAKYALFSVLGAMFLSVDIVIMQFLLGPEDVSIYGTAMKVILAVILFFEVLTGVFMPRLARQYETAPEQFRVDMRRFTLVMLVGVVAASLGLVAFGPMAISLAFGPEFVGSGDVLRMLSLVLVFRVMTMVSGSLLTVTGLQSFRAMIMAVIVPVHIVLNLIMQPALGYWGAVVALGMSFTFVFLFNLGVFLFLLPQKKEP